MGKFKLKQNKFFKFLNESTYVGNINTGQIIPPNMYNSQEIVKPIPTKTKKPKPVEPIEPVEPLRRSSRTPVPNKRYV